MHPDKTSLNHCVTSRFWICKLKDHGVVVIMIVIMLLLCCIIKFLRWSGIGDMFDDMLRGCGCGFDGASL